MAGVLGSIAQDLHDTDGDGFDHWLIQRSFSMLAPMCRIGLVVVALMLLVVDPILYRNGIWGANPQHASLVAWHGCAALYFLAFLVWARSGTGHAQRTRRPGAVPESWRGAVLRGSPSSPGRSVATCRPMPCSC